MKKTKNTVSVLETRPVKEVTIKLSNDIVEQIVAPFRNEIRLLQLKNKELIESAESEKINELQHEIENLNKRLEMSVAELDSEKELKAYKKFCKKHEKCRLSSKVNGGKAPYVIFYGTGLGSCKKVVCQVCGEAEDITDISVW